MKWTNVIAIPQAALFDPVHEKYVSESLHIRRRDGVEQVFTKTDLVTEVTASARIEEGFYAGIKFNHFGHFLLESLSRLSNLKSSGHSNVIWTSKTNNTIFAKWQIEIFHLLGIENYNHIVVIEPTWISNIEVAPQEYIIWDLFTSFHERFLGVYKPKDEVSERKLWLSRENVDGGWTNERIIQDILIENGWTVVHPEKHSIAEQLQMMLTSTLVAGIEGSAFHSLIFADKVRQKVVIFSRITKSRLKSHKINNNYNLIASVKGFEQIEHNIEQYPIKGKNAKTESIANCLEVFEVLGIQTSNDQVKKSVQQFYIEKQCSMK